MMTEDEKFINDISDYVSVWQDVPGANLKEDLKDHIAGLLNKNLDDRFYAYIDFRFSKGSLIANTAEQEWEYFKEKYATYKLFKEKELAAKK